MTTPRIVKPDFPVPDDKTGPVEIEEFSNGSKMYKSVKTQHICPDRPVLGRLMRSNELMADQERIPDGTFYECTCGRVWIAETDDGLGVEIYERYWKQITIGNLIKMGRFMRLKNSQ